MRRFILVLLLWFPVLLFSNPFPGMEIEEDNTPYQETQENAPIQERSHFRAFRWGDDRPSVLQREKATFFTNVLQEKGLVITLFTEKGKKWLPFLTRDIFIGYVFDNNRLILGYYLVPLNHFDEATNLYERMKSFFIRQYTDKASYSLTFINPPLGDLDGVLAFIRWKTTNTSIEMTLERDKMILDPRSRKEVSIPFVIVMSYTDISQEQRLFKATADHP